MYWRFFLLALLTVGCSTRAQIVVVVESNLDVPAEIDSIEVAVRGPEGVSTVAPQALDQPDSPSFPLTLGVAPESDALGPITITAIGRLAGVEVVRQSATVTLTQGETRVVHLVLYRSCVGRACAAAETCDAAGCATDVRDDLPLWTGGPPTYDDTDPCLAMTWDVDGDGEGSDACGGTDCDDSEPLAFSAAVEDCDGIDNNCDGVVDEDCDCSPLASVQPCMTSCGSTGEQTCTMTGWSTCVIPREVCNAIDDDCDGLTDEGLVYEAGTPLQITATTRDSIEPDLLWTGGNYAVAWRDETDERGVHFQTLTERGAVLNAVTRLSVRGHDPVLAWSGSTYGVFWWYSEIVSTTRFERMVFTVLTPDGVSMDGNFQVDGNAASEPRPSIVWDGTQYVLGYLDTSMMLEARSEAGERIGARYDIPADREGPFDLVWTGTQLAIVFTRSDGVYFSQGRLDTFAPMELTIGNFDQPSSPSMLWSGDRFLVAVSAESPFRGGGPLELIELDSTGATVAPHPTLTGSQAESAFGSGTVPPGMASAPGQVMVTWVDDRDGGADVYFVRLSPDGAILQPPTRVLGPGGVSNQTTVAWSGQSFGVVWSEELPDADTDLMFARIACASPTPSTP